MLHQTPRVFAFREAQQVLQYVECALPIAGKTEAGVLKDKPLPTISMLIISEESRNSGNPILPQVSRVILAQTTSF